MQHHCAGSYVAATLLLVLFACSFTQAMGIATVQNAQKRILHYNNNNNNHSPISAASCTINANMNTSSMPPSTLPPKFATTAADCCTQCESHNSCVAAVWHSYYCHMLTSVVGIEPLVPSPGFVVILTSTTTTSTTTTTTAAPTTTSTSTAAPTPIPTTAAPPTPAPNSMHPPGIGVVRSVVCQSSPTCNISEDATCATTVFYNNVCSATGQEYSCQTSMVDVINYTDATCTTETNTLQELTNVCGQQMGLAYEAVYCDSYATYAVAGVSVSRSSCATTCNGGGDECSTTNFTTGACHANTIPNSVNGNFIVAWCYPTYVVYLGFDEEDCRGTYFASTAEPVGPQCYQDESYNYIQNMCG
ncbi:membrane-associated protein, putative [Bodo saltans]|uniref:Membrane-associated protein, putative n=1 Tax=Bodo saltans TaxID=75058 RepID=A0A0S4J679_BODSA|nr:membrane-associated protein, putative [Bodo saltans]|eukprot:CUG86931.1 membrane-associated protein, putative [Bodo saltans]